MENENTDNKEVLEAAQADEPAKAERLFTQEEVNEIIRKRLAKEKAKEASSSSANDAELTARASRLDCKEYILNNGLSMDLLDVIDTSDVAAFKEKAAKIKDVIDKAVPAYPTVKDGGSVRKVEEDPDAAIKKAFSKGAAHKPKQWNELQGTR